MDQITHIVVAIFDDTLTGCLVPTGKAAHTWSDRAFITYDRAVFVLIGDPDKFFFIEIVN